MSSNSYKDRTILNGDVFGDIGEPISNVLKFVDIVHHFKHMRPDLLNGWTGNTLTVVIAKSSFAAGDWTNNFFHA